MPTRHHTSVLNTCPRCAGRFRCGAHDRGSCECEGLKLPPAVLAEIQARYTGCLCTQCLRELLHEHSSARP